MRVDSLLVDRELDDFDLNELKPTDLAAAQAAVDAAVAAESQGLIACSCCCELYDNVLELHLHQTKHSLEELSLALISLRGLESPINNFELVDAVKEEEQFLESAHLHNLLLDSVSSRQYDSDSESTITVNSEARMVCMSPEYFDSFGYPDDSVSAPEFVEFPYSPCYSGLNSAANSQKMSSQVYGSHLRNLLINDSINKNVDYVFHSRDVNGNNVGGSMWCKREKGLSREEEPPIGRNYLSGGFLPRNMHPRQSAQNVGKKTYRFESGNDSKLKRFGKEDSSSSLPPVQTVSFSDEIKNTTSSKHSKKSKAKKNNVSSIQDERLFICDICDRKYKKKSHLERHIRVHTGEKPYACSVCHKSFGIRSVLKQHIRTHTGEKPYSCTVCLHRFRQKSGLMTHMMLHNGKPFKCQYCVKSFVSNHKLRIHLRTHELRSDTSSDIGPYSCANCSMRFYTIGALLQHCKVHNPEDQEISQSNFSSDNSCTITEEAARAAVSVVGKAVQHYDGGRLNTFADEMMGDYELHNEVIERFPNWEGDDGAYHSVFMKSDAISVYY